MRFRLPNIAVGIFLALTAPAAAQPPNIVYIISDDQGWKDVGYHGSDIKTPNIDALAAGGARLEQFYAQAFCTQTRAALMTGRYPFRYGLQTAVIPSSHAYGLATDEYLLPEALKAAGYDTALIGKWHLGHADKKYWPMQRGFDHHYGPLIGEIDYFTHEQHGVTRLVPRQSDARRARLFHQSARRRRRETDRGARPEDAAVPRSRLQRAACALSGAAGRHRQISAIADPTKRVYAAQITVMDDEIGRVVAALDKKGLRDNTLIVFQSDNGGTRNAMFSGEQDMSKLVIPNDNGPYREGKGTLYEGGNRVVALANWPGHIKPGSTVEGMIHVVDMLPTLVGLAGGSAAKSKPLDGLDVWGDDQPRQALAAHGGDLQSRTVPRRRPARRLEADLAHALATGRRALRHRPRPL